MNPAAVPTPRTIKHVSKAAVKRRDNITNWARWSPAWILSDLIFAAGCTTGVA